MKDMMRRFFAAVLVLAVVCACLPVVAFAEETEVYSAMRCEGIDEIVSGARYILIASNTNLALGDFNEAEDALELYELNEGEEEGYIDFLTDDDFFVLECVDEEYWTITTPSGKGVAPMPPDGEEILDGLSVYDGFPWDLYIEGEDELLVSFMPSDMSLPVTLVADTGDRTAYAAYDTGDVIPLFKLYICLEDAVDPDPQYEMVEIEEAEVIIPDVLCGDVLKGFETPVVQARDPEEEDNDNLPGVTVPENDLYLFESAYWLVPSDEEHANLGFVTLEEDTTVLGGDKCYVGVILYSSFLDNMFGPDDPIEPKSKTDLLADAKALFAGLREEDGDDEAVPVGYFTLDTEYIASNATCVASDVDFVFDEEGTMGLLGIAVFEIEVQHVPGEPEEDRVEPTCLDDGSYVEKTYCEKCGQLVEEKEGVLDALGHDWGEWVVTKEPTATEYGEETRICRRDPSHVETRPIDPLGENPDTGDSTDLAKWMSLSALSLAVLYFSRKRENG